MAARGKVKKKELRDEVQEALGRVRGTVAAVKWGAREKVIGGDGAD